MPGYAVILDKVPGLSVTAQSNIRKLVADKKKGVQNNPRPFSTEELAEKGIVSMYMRVTICQGFIIK